MKNNISKLWTVPLHLSAKFGELWLTNHSSWANFRIYFIHTEVTEPESTEFCYVFGSAPDLKIQVQNFEGFSSKMWSSKSAYFKWSKTWGPKTAYFVVLRQLRDL